MTINECYNNITWCKNEILRYEEKNTGLSSDITNLEGLRTQFTTMRTKIETAAVAGVGAINNMCDNYYVKSNKSSSLFNNANNIYMGSEYNTALQGIDDAIAKINNKITSLQGKINKNSGEIEKLEGSIQWYYGEISRLSSMEGEGENG